MNPYIDANYNVVVVSIPESLARLLVTLSEGPALLAHHGDHARWHAQVDAYLARVNKNERSDG